LLSKISNGVLLSIFAYLLGSIPFGFIIPKIKGIDIRTIGSKATSATNVSRALGWRWGLLSGGLDIFKGAIPSYLALNYLTNGWQIIGVSLLPVFGHIFPVWLKFKGGRGAATFFGATAVLIGPKFFSLFFLIWILILALSKIMSLANLLFPWILSILLFIFFPFPYFIYGILAASLITFALRENIKRLRQGVEPRVSFRW
jgi:glycerol-3-phosphate acyltransferase PlsY